MVFIMVVLVLNLFENAEMVLGLMNILLLFKLVFISVIHAIQIHSTCHLFFNITIAVIIHAMTPFIIIWWSCSSRDDWASLRKCSSNILKFLCIFWNKWFVIYGLMGFIRPRRSCRLSCLIILNKLLQAHILNLIFLLYHMADIIYIQLEFFLSLFPDFITCLFFKQKVLINELIITFSFLNNMRAIWAF